jgi:AcrR family transcriptional regulator
LIHDGSPAPSATARFSKKREAIVAAATAILNQRGVKGMTLAEVAEQVGLITTSVTYYFRKKEALAAACFTTGLERLRVMVRQAHRAAHSPPGRIRALVNLYLAERRRICAGEAPPIPVFSDIRALAEPHLAPVAEAYGELFRAVRGLFQARGYDWLDRRAATARTQILLEQLHWLEAWIGRYDVEDYPRVAERMVDILVNGLGSAETAWAPVIVPAPALDCSSARELFLFAATRLINAYGYRGASVEKISSELNVTKGSFYHHHNAKDDLVVDCFERSFEVIRRVQASARALEGDQWLTLSSAVASLADYQFSPQGPLLRTTALAALPETIRDAMVEHAGRMADRFATMISDGIAEGSVRAVDPAIAAQMIMAAVNAASDLQHLLQGRVAREEFPALYARPTVMGLLCR